MDRLEVESLVLNKFINNNQKINSSDEFMDEGWNYFTEAVDNPGKLRMQYATDVWKKYITDFPTVDKLTDIKDNDSQYKGSSAVVPFNDTLIKALEILGDKKVVTRTQKSVGDDKLIEYFTIPNIDNSPVLIYEIESKGNIINNKLILVQKEVTIKI